MNFNFMPRRSISLFMGLLLVAIYATGILTNLQNKFILNHAIYQGSPYYSWVSYAVIHGGIVHLVFNFIALVQIGPQAERSLSPISFILFTIICAGFSGVSAVWLSAIFGADKIILVGFSAVIFGYIGAIAGLFIKYSENKLQTAFNLAIQNPMPLAFIIVPLFIDLNISGEGHLMGFVFGLIAAKYFAR